MMGCHVKLVIDY